jgi:hypothetical protein
MLSLLIISGLLYVLSTFKNNSYSFIVFSSFSKTNLTKALLYESDKYSTLPLFSSFNFKYLLNSVNGYLFTET